MINKIANADIKTRSVFLMSHLPQAPVGFTGHVTAPVSLHPGPGRALGDRRDPYHSNRQPGWARAWGPAAQTIAKNSMILKKMLTTLSQLGLLVYTGKGMGSGEIFRQMYHRSKLTPMGFVSFTHPAEAQPWVVAFISKANRAASYLAVSTDDVTSVCTS